MMPYLSPVVFLSVFYKTIDNREKKTTVYKLFIIHLPPTEGQFTIFKNAGRNFRAGVSTRKSVYGIEE